MSERQASVTIKVGVSRMSVAFHQGAGITRLAHWPTPTADDSETFRAFFGSLWSDLSLKDLPAALVCVVPDLRRWVRASWRERTGKEPIDFSLEDAPFHVAYRPPESLGADRAACVWGVLAHFGETIGNSFVVADIGTHTVATVCVSGELLGGGILPGLFLMQKSLGGGRVDQLRGKDVLRKELIRRAPVVGMTTEEGIFAGVVGGSVDAVLGLRRRAEETYKRSLPIVLTGGLSWLVTPLFPPRVLVNRQLLHYGARSFLAGR